MNENQELERERAVVEARIRTAEAERTWSAVRKFATGVAVVTAGADEAVHGTTVSAFTFISWNPALISICLCPGGKLLHLVAERGSFAVNVLASGQAELARQFADPRRRPGLGQFESVPWIPGGDGKVPLLLGAVCWLDCRYLRHETVGDHDVVLAEVASVTESEGAPLLYFGGKLYPAVIR